LYSIDADLADMGNASIIGGTSSVQLVGGYDMIRNAMVSDAAASEVPILGSFLLFASGLLAFIGYDHHKRSRKR